MPTLCNELLGAESLGTFRSSLLVLKNSLFPALDFAASLYADRVSGLAIVRHADTLVIGARFRRRISDPIADRTVSHDEQTEIRDLLPPELRVPSLLGRWTAGFKTESLDPDGYGTVAPWIKGPDDHGVDNLILGIPGKASLAWYAADRIVDYAVSIAEGAIISERAEPPPGVRWTEPFAMHFDATYSEMDDSRTSQ